MLSGFCAADFFPYYGQIIDILTGFGQKLRKCFIEFDKFYETFIQEHLEPCRPRLEHEDITDVLIALSNDETGPLHLSKDNISCLHGNISNIVIEFGLAQIFNMFHLTIAEPRYLFLPDYIVQPFSITINIASA